MAELMYEAAAISLILCSITLFYHFKEGQGSSHRMTAALPAADSMLSVLCIKPCLAFHATLFLICRKKSAKFGKNGERIIRRRPHHQHHASLQSSPQTSSTSKSAAYVTMRMI